MASESREARGSAEKKSDAPVQQQERVAIRFAISSGVPVCRRWIGHAPMRRHGLARPDRDRFLRGVIANREHEIHARRIGPGELVPTFASQPIHWQIFADTSCARAPGCTVPLGWLPALYAVKCPAPHNSGSLRP